VIQKSNQGNGRFRTGLEKMFFRVINIVAFVFLNFTAKTRNFARDKIETMYLVWFPMTQLVPGSQHVGT